MFISVLAGIAVLLVILYACTKTEDSVFKSTKFESPAKTAQRSAGSITYYSKDSLGTVYKMVLSTDANGIVDIDRSVYNTNEPDTFKVRVYTGEGVNFIGYTFNVDSNQYYGDTLKIEIPPAKTYYVIPFIPGFDPQERPGTGGDGGGSMYCQCGCFEQFLCCMENGEVLSSADCVGICDYCIAVSDMCPGVLGWSKVENVGGFVVIDANGVNVLN